ncbi:PID-CTERM protein-sorting domain-containing protein [Gracilimonas mengyeensis]|uniref:MYXO-CTERM domain-containing protein n=1 Tax=Gracilimonas mengyeensis TaxID=1302730 RepID=A0A521CB56_9BACT|nr:hypothetical protein [Gracilimonas mengyeensis]SMO56624.1 hypothetical protein SAMN06265219_1056 [Gracilimonas mengyeensis]
MKLFYITILTVILLLFTSTLLLAQPPGLPATPDQAPIDGGLGWLALFGGGYALKKLKDRRSVSE